MLVRIAAAVLVTVTGVGATQPNNGESSQHWAGVTESSQTVYVQAKSTDEPTSQPAQNHAAPPYECSEHEDSTYREAAESSGDHAGGDGSWYRWTCTGDAAQLGMALIPDVGVVRWEPKAGPASPREVARTAADKIHLGNPALRMSPPAGLPQWVNFPMFLWTEKTSWRPQSATASVPGVQVSATATPISLVWDMGDGTTVTCTGPGTPFTTATPANASSPDCGHVYRRVSATEPGGKFAVRVTESWRVAWNGGGQSGTLPNMTATSSIAVLVAESQALVTSVR